MISYFVCSRLSISWCVKIIGRVLNPQQVVSSYNAQNGGVIQDCHHRRHEKEEKTKKGFMDWIWWICSDLEEIV